MISTRVSRGAAVVGLLAVLATAACSGSDTIAGVGTHAGASGSTSAVPASGARFLDPTEAATIRADIQHAVEVTSTYDYRTLARSRAAGLAVSTGAFRAKFLKTYQTVLEKQASAVRIVQTATVLEAGLGPATATSATVLLIGQLAVTNKTVPKGRIDPFTVTAQAQKVSGHWLLADLRVDGTISGHPPGTPQLSTALATARSTTADVLSFRRATFAADYARALAQTTGPLRADILGRRAKTLRAMLSGGFDLAAVVRAAAVASASGATAVVLVTLDAYRVTKGRRSASMPQQLKVTVVSGGGKWLVSDLTAVGTR